MKKIHKRQIRSFWEEHPLCTYEIIHPLGTPNFFDEHDRIRKEAELLYREFCEYDKHGGERGLDVGCGIGWVVCEYAKYDAKMTGIDITSKAVELAKKRLQLLGLNAEIFEADAENLPFKDNHFDFVTSYGVLHHTPNTQKGIDEVYRTLKPGGKAILSLYYKNICHNRYAFPFLIRFLNLIGAKMHGVEELKPASVQEFVNWYDGKENPLGKIYTKKQIKEMFSKFSNLTVEVHWFPKRFIPQDNKIPRRLLRFLDKRIGFLIFIKGYKR